LNGRVRVLLVSGSTRSGSTNTAALATAAELAPDQVTAVRYGGLAALPVGYVGAVIVESACRHVPVDRAAIGPRGTVTDPGFTAGLTQVWDALLLHISKEA
jgi:hypothetical protein